MNTLKKLGGKLVVFAKDSIRSRDMFPSKVELTYKGNTNFTTLFGGLVSLIIKIIVILYAVYLMFVIFRRTNSSKSVNRLVRDRTYDTTKHYLGRNNFSFAVKLAGIKPDLVFDKTYFDLVVSYSHYSRNSDGTFINYQHNVIEMEK